MTDTEAAYFAGFLDADGSITISDQGGRSRQLVVQITQKYPGIFEWAIPRFGGHLTSYTAKTGREYWRWFITGQAAQSFLEGILPFLLLKRIQAKLALTFPIGSVRGSLTEEDHTHREAIRAEIMYLNAGGER